MSEPTLYWVQVRLLDYDTARISLDGRLPGLSELTMHLREVTSWTITEGSGIDWQEGEDKVLHLHRNIPSPWRQVAELIERVVKQHQQLKRTPRIEFCNQLPDSKVLVLDRPSQ